MFWNIGDEEPDDPRFTQAGPGACGLYFMAGAWCLRQVRWRPEAEIPGEWFIPDRWVRGWPNGARLAARLVAVGLWTATTGGYYFEWIRPENTPDAVRADRKRKRAKKARQRARADRVTGGHVYRGTYTGDMTPPAIDARITHESADTA